MVKLIEEAYSRTKSNVLDDFETLAKYDDEVLYTVGWNMKTNLLESLEQLDYAEWGKQHSTEESSYGCRMNSLLYAVITAVFDESMFKTRIISGTSCDVIWLVTHPDEDAYYSDWQEEALEDLRDNYRESLIWQAETYMNYVDKYEDETVGNVILLRFSEGCDDLAVAALMDEILKDCFMSNGNSFTADVVCHDPGYHESGLECDLEKSADALVAFLKKYGFPKRRKPGAKLRKAARMITESIKEENHVTGSFIQEIRGVKGSGMQIIL